MTTTKTTPRQRVQQALDEMGNVLEAARQLEKQARRDRALYDYLTQPWLARASYEAVRTISRSNRESIWTAPNYTLGGNGHRVEAHARTLLDFPLPDGTPLREATKPLLMQATEFYSEQADDMAHKARWLALVAEHVGRRKVGNALTLDELEALKVEAGEPSWS